MPPPFPNAPWILDSIDLWICSDCLLLLANGDTPEDDGEEKDCETCEGVPGPLLPSTSHDCHDCGGTGKASTPTLAERIDANWQVSESTREREPTAERWDLALGGACTCDRYADPRRCQAFDEDGDGPCGESGVTHVDPISGQFYCEDCAPPDASEAPYQCDKGGTEDRQCDTREFSWSDCDACGSHLGGSRHKATAFLMRGA